MPKMEKADAVEAMLSEMRCAPPTDAQRAASLQRQLDTLYAAFVVMERERDEAIRDCGRFQAALNADIRPYDLLQRCCDHPDAPHDLVCDTCVSSEAEPSEPEPK